MKKFNAILLCLLIVFSMSFFTACNKNELPDQDNGIEIFIADVEHCNMSVVGAKKAYFPLDVLTFDYELDDGYALERLKAEIEDAEGTVSVKEYDFTDFNILWCLLDDWKRVTFTPIITVDVDPACSLNIKKRFGGDGTVKWMFDYVPKGAEDNWLLVEPDGNSYLEYVKTIGLYDDPAVGYAAQKGGYIIDGYGYDYDSRGERLVCMGFKREEEITNADEVYIEISFISKQNACLLQFSCKNDFKRTEPYDYYAASISTQTVVCEKGKPYYYNFGFMENYNAIVRNAYEFIGWTDEYGNIVCDTLSGEFFAENDETFYITFRDLLE